MPTKGYRTEAERRLTMGDALGLTKLPKLRHAMNAGGQPGDVPTFIPPGTRHPKDSPRDERGRLVEPPWVMSFGEQFVELLGEFVDAREEYAHSRRGVNGEYANRDDMNKAGDRLQALLDKKFP